MSNEISVQYRGERYTPDTCLENLGDKQAVTLLLFDFNKDGEINSDNGEWQFFEKIANIEAKQHEISHPDMKQRVSNYYKKKLEKLEKEFDKVDEKFLKLDRSALDEFEKFEVEHEIYFRPLNPKCKPDKSKKLYNVEAMQMGVFDEKEHRFTGECCKYAYIEGLDKLTEDEKKQFEKLFKAKIKIYKQLLDYEKRIEKLVENHKRMYALYDCAEAGMITDILNSQDEDKYVQIHNQNNPILPQIQQLSAKIHSLHLKACKTPEENLVCQREINKCYDELRVLENISWSIAKMDKKDIKQSGNKKGDLNVTIEVDNSTQTTNEENGIPIDNTTTLTTRINFNKDKLSISAANTTTMGISCSDAKVRLANFAQSIGVRYGWFNANISGNFYDTAQNKNENLRTELGVDIDGWALNGSVDISHTDCSKDQPEMQMCNDNNNDKLSMVYSASLSKKINNCSVGALYRNQCGQNMVETNFNYSSSIKANEKLGFNINPGTTASYNFEAKAFNVVPNLGLGLSFSTNNFSIETGINNSSVIIANVGKTNQGNNEEQGSAMDMSCQEQPKVSFSNSFSTNCSMNYKKWHTNINYMNGYSKESSSNTVSFKSGYKINETFDISAGYQFSANKFDNGKGPTINTNSHKASVLLTVNLNNAKKKKPHKSIDK